MTPQRAYLLIPRRLILDLGDNRLALALYCWIARLFLVIQAPVPLSRADVQCYDPSAKAGAIERALDRLVADGWLVRTDGRKRRYTPTWGRRRGADAPLPWRMDAPTLGRPHHVATVRIARALLDVCIGRFRPHDRTPLVERYVSQPLLSLRDVGEYLRLAAGLPAHDDTALQRWGLVADGALRPIPDDETLLALVTQRAMTGAVALTRHGWQRLGWDLAPDEPAQAPVAAEPAVPVVIPPDLIGRLIPRRIGRPIGEAEEPYPVCAASPRAARPLVRRRAMIPGNHGKDRELRDSPPTPPGGDAGGGSDQSDAGRRVHRRRPPRAAPAAHPTVPAPAPNAPPDTDALPDTDAVRALSAFGVADPGCLRALAAAPLDQVHAAIAYATAAGLGPGWVVQALRRHCATGWSIPCPAPRGGWSAAEIAAWVQRDASGLFRLGSDCADLPSGTVPDPSSDPAAPAVNDATHGEDAAARSSSGAEPPAPAERKGAPPSAARRAAGAAAAACPARRSAVTAPTSGSGHAVGPPVRDALADHGHPRPTLNDGEQTRLIRLWNQVRHTMRTILPRHGFDAWFRRARLLALNDGAATISVPASALSGFEQRCLRDVQRVLRDLAGPVTVRLVTDSADGSADAADDAGAGDLRTAAPGESDRLAERPMAWEAPQSSAGASDTSTATRRSPVRAVQPAHRRMPHATADGVPAGAAHLRRGWSPDRLVPAQARDSPQ